MKSIAVTLYLHSIAVVACAGNPGSMQPADGQPVAEIATSPTAELPPQEAPAKVAKAKPTKGAAADLLVKLCAAIEGRDLDAIMSCWHSFPESYEAEARRHFARADSIEINREALDKLIKLGQWGPISEVYPSTGSNLSNLLDFWKLDAGACWALRLYPAEVALHWDGTAFHVIECDDVDKL